LDPVGVYLHFPWCRKRCPYCDFAVETGDAPHERYRDAVIAELEARAARFPGRLVSIYLGGGTPSLWRPDCIASVIRAIAARWGRTPDELDEITIEANPTDVVPQTLAAWRAAGIGRISIGVQSLAADELVVLGRDHRFGDGLAAVEHALAGGFRVSADFILGTPPRREPTWIEPVTRSAVDHLSVYELTIEDRTVFGQRVKAGSLQPLPDDELTELYVAADAALVTAGFEHYEISSYARPGHRAVHNSLYWRGAAFLGLGVGAASLELLPGGGGVRATNPRRVADYFAGAPPEIVTSSTAELAAERAWLGMRTADGVDERDLPPEVTSSLVTDGLANHANGRISPTLRGFLLANRIAARITEAM
jgi:putative oxygen-independent coproporphyrinogen III oxidase